MGSITSIMVIPIILWKILNSCVSGKEMHWNWRKHHVALKIERSDNLKCEVISVFRVIALNRGMGWKTP